MRIDFLLERGSPPRSNPIIAQTMEILRAAGATVALTYAEEQLHRLDRLAVTADLYLLKSDTELAFSLATALESLGGRVINPTGACLLSKDKVLAAATLARAGIPAPRSLTAAVPVQLEEELSRQPLILKPPRGYHGVGITVVEDASDLPASAFYPDMVFAQEYLRDARKDLKIFGIGSKIFGVRKPFSRNSYREAGSPCPLPPDVERMARRCARAFRLELFGLDLAECGEDVYVLDVNYFPGYRGVPDAARLLADYILSRASA